MTKKTSFTITAFSYLGAAIFFTSVNPGKLPIGLLLVPFLVIFLVLYMTLYSLALVFFEEVNLGKKLIITSVASMATLLALIQTVTQLTLRDIVLAVAIVLILVWYLSKTSRKTT